jgi:hypothetical protein
VASSVGCAELAAIGLCITHAVREGRLETQVWWWRLGLMISLLLPVGTFAYHQWLDPSARVPRTYQMVVNGTQIQVVPLFGEVGGEPQNLETGAYGQNGLIGGQTYEFECSSRGRDGAEWFRYHRFGRIWWAPRANLHTPTSTHEPEVPPC